jgi:hypothetical protein
VTRSQLDSSFCDARHTGEGKRPPDACVGEQTNFNPGKRFCDLIPSQKAIEHRPIIETLVVATCWAGGAVGEPVGELSLTPTGCALLINEQVTGAVRLSLSNGRCKQGAVKMFSGVAAQSEVRN